MVTGGDEEDYKSNIDCLVDCLRCVQGKWLEYEDIVSIRAERFKYRYQVESIVFKEEDAHDLK